MTRIRFIAEKGNQVPGSLTVDLDGMEDLPKFLPITTEDNANPVGTAKAFIENGQLLVEAELNEDDFALYPSIGLESIEDENLDGEIIVRRSRLDYVSLRSVPNPDPGILSISGQLNSGEALLMYY